MPSHLQMAGADMLSTGDSPAGMIGPDLYREFALWGNLDPVGVLRSGTPEAVKAAAAKAVATVRSHGRMRFVLSTGCTLAPDTPAENIEAFTSQVRENLYK